MGVDEESQEALLHDEKSPCPAKPDCAQSSWRLLTFSWILTASFFCSTIFFAFRHPAISICPAVQICPAAPAPDYRFLTDFVPAFPELVIRMVEKNFTNDLRFNGSSQYLYNEPLDPQEIRYIGEPSPEIDAAWKALLSGQYVAITSEEAAQFPAEHQQKIEYGGRHNFFEFSVFHNLHCLNELRMALDPERYGTEHMSGGVWGKRVHVDHCIDQLRQAIQCHGDLTPVPLLPIPDGPSGLIIGNGETHMCKDFDVIKEWVTARSKVMRPLGE